MIKIKCQYSCLRREENRWRVVKNTVKRWGRAEVVIMEMVLGGRKAIWDLGLTTGIDNQPDVEGEREERWSFNASWFSNLGTRRGNTGAPISLRWGRVVKFSIILSIACSLECDYGIAIFSMGLKIFTRKYNLTHCHSEQMRENMVIWNVYFKHQKDLFL